MGSVLKLIFICELEWLCHGTDIGWKQLDHAGFKKRSELTHVTYFVAETGEQN